MGRLVDRFSPFRAHANGRTAWRRALPARGDTPELASVLIPEAPADAVAELRGTR